MGFISTVADLIILDILCIICSIPIVTYGAASSAKYYVAMKKIRGEDTGTIKPFFKAFFQNFKQKFDDFKASYSNLKLSQETQDFLSNKKEVFDQMESQKAGELFEPILVKGEQFAKTFTDFSLLYLMNYHVEGVEENVIEEKIRKGLGVASDASDEELQKAENTALGITSDASIEEKNKALEDWLRTNFGIDGFKSEEDAEKAIEHVESNYGNELSILNSYDESSDEMKDIMPEDLKERFEKYKNTTDEIVDILTLAGLK